MPTAEKGAQLPPDPHQPPSDHHSTVDKLVTWLRSRPRVREIIAYIQVSFIAMSLDVAIFMTLLSTDLVSGTIAGSASYLIALVLHYLLSVRLVFNPLQTGKSSKRLAAEYIATGFVGVSITAAIIHSLTVYFGVWAVIAKAIGIGASFIAVFLLRSLLVFKAKPESVRELANAERDADAALNEHKKLRHELAVRRIQKLLEGYRIAVLIPCLDHDASITGTAAAYRAFIAASVTVATILLATLPIIGIDAWIGYIQKVAPYHTADLQNFQGFYTHMMVSVWSGLRAMGVDNSTALAAQAVVSVVVLATTVFTVRQTRNPMLRAFVVVTAVPLITPYAFNYDLTASAAVIAWLVVGSVPLSRELRLLLPMFWMTPALVMIPALQQSGLPQILMITLFAISIRMAWGWNTESDKRAEMQPMQAPT